MMSTFAVWRRYFETVRELSRLSDRQLEDLGIARHEIRTVARLAPGMGRDEVGSLVGAQPTKLHFGRQPYWYDAGRFAGPAARA